MRLRCWKFERRNGHGGDEETVQGMALFEVKGTEGLLLLIGCTLFNQGWAGRQTIVIVSSQTTACLSCLLGLLLI